MMKKKNKKGEKTWPTSVLPQPLLRWFDYLTQLLGSNMPSLWLQLACWQHWLPDMSACQSFVRVNALAWLGKKMSEWPLFAPIEWSSSLHWTIVERKKVQTLGTNHFKNNTLDSQHTCSGAIFTGEDLFAKSQFSCNSVPTTEMPRWRWYNGWLVCPVIKRHGFISNWLY